MGVGEGEAALALMPSAVEGSGSPQCALIGCPGQTGHTSLAALSQTVKTKSSSDAWGAANSSQDFERNFEVS